MNHGLDNQTVERIQSVLARYPQVEKAILYGSRAKGNYHRGSDIDLTLSGPGLDRIILGRIDHELDDLLLPYRIDLSNLAHITHTELLDHIRRVGVVFYQK